MHRLRFILYTRKSTESDDRQVQSIDDQVRIMTEVASRYSLNVIKTYRESKSAKKPDNRPLFDEMMAKFENGLADGILCWHTNRLSRNPIDSGRIGWLLQNSKIKAIQTSDRLYRPEDNVLIFGVESSMNNQFILDLSKSVRRGIASKLEKGGWPGVAPVGYLNKLDDHTIIPDPDRFPLIRRAWDEMLTGLHNVPAILIKLNDEWGFRSVKRKHSGGRPIAYSNLYKVFNNPFYKGVILHEGQEYPGSHEPMITAEEFDRVQMLLGKKAKHRVRRHSFPFTGLIHCGECGCLITAQEKSKTIKGTGEIHHYVYYNCTRKKTGIECSQRKAVRQELLERQIESEIAKYTILPQFRDWALEILRSANDNEIVQRSQQQASLQSALNGHQRELDALTQMRYRELIDDEEFLRQRGFLQITIKRLQEEIGKTESRAEEWLETTEKVFNFAVGARDIFNSGTSDEKRGVLAALGQNPTLLDGKLMITPYKWLQPIAECYPALERTYRRLEPKKNVSGCTISNAPVKIITPWQGH